MLSVHQGCGLTNAMTGITEAAKSRTPLVVLAADVAGSAVGSNFRIDQDALVRSVGAVPERVHSPGSAVDDVARAYRTASHGRRTVVLNLPLDVQAAEVEPTVRLEPLPPAPRTAPEPDVAEPWPKLLRAAERPVFLAGRGALAYGREIAALADRVGALLATSAVAAGHVRGDPYDLGISRRVRHPAGRRAGRRRGPGGGLGLQPDQLDHPARPPPRPGARCWCRSTTIPPPSAPVDRWISACWQTSV